MPDLSKFDFYETYKWTLRYMYFTKCHPEIPRNKKWYWQMFYKHGSMTILFIILIYGVLFHDIPKKELARACFNGSFLCYGVILNLQWVLVNVHRESLGYIISDMKKKYDEAPSSLSDVEKEIMVSFAKRGRFASILWTTMMLTALYGLVVKSILLTIYYTLIKGEPRYLLVVDTLTYPPYLEEKRQNFLWHIFIFSFENYSLLYGSCLYVSITIWGPICILHACSQIELVKLRVEVLFKENDNDADIERKFKDITMRLQDIHMFIKHTNMTFTYIYEVIMKGTSVCIPLILFQVLESTKNSESSLSSFSVELWVILAVLFVISGGPCYYGEVLMKTSDNLRDTLYMCGWETRWEKKSMKRILILLTMMSRPMVLKIMFKNLCHATLTEVYNQAYAIFNLLYAVYD